MTMSLAGLITTIGIIILGVADLFFVLFQGTGSSVSDFMIRAGFKAPMIVFALGYVAGHLTGYMRLRPDLATKEELDQMCKEKTT
jgi:hypothetical protein